MKDHVPGIVVEGEVVFGQGGLPGVEGGLIAESVGAVTQGGSQVDHRTKERTSIMGGEGRDNHHLNIFAQILRSIIISQISR